MSNIEDKKLKRKIDEAPTLDVADPKPSQSLRRDSSPMGGESTSKSSKSMKTSTDFDSSVKSFEPSNDGERKQNLSLDHLCQYCDKKFSSPHALGGHQNAHRHERLIKREKEKFFYGHELDARSSTHACSSASHLYHGAQLQHPMAQMHDMSWPRLSSVAYAHYQGLNLPSTSFTGHRFGSTSSWSGGGAVPRRLNLQGLRLFDPINPIPPPINNEANQSHVHAGVGKPLEDPTVSLAAPQATKELDLALKLSFP